MEAHPPCVTSAYLEGGRDLGGLSGGTTVAEVSSYKPRQPLSWGKSYITFSGHRFKLEAEVFIFDILQRNLPNFGVKILALSFAKSLESF